MRRAHFRSPARRTIITRTPCEDDECKSGFVAFEKAMYGLKDTWQRFDFVRETRNDSNALFDRTIFSP